MKKRKTTASKATASASRAKAKGKGTVRSPRVAPSRPWSAKEMEEAQPLPVPTVDAAQQSAKSTPSSRKVGSTSPGGRPQDA
jgi:hypothetical protein